MFFENSVHFVNIYHGFLFDVMGKRVVFSHEIRYRRNSPIIRWFVCKFCVSFGNFGSNTKFSETNWFAEPISDLSDNSFILSDNLERNCEIFSQNVRYVQKLHRLLKIHAFLVFLVSCLLVWLVVTLVSFVDDFCCLAGIV